MAVSEFWKMFHVEQSAMKSPFDLSAYAPHIRTLNETKRAAGGGTTRTKGQQGPPVCLWICGHSRPVRCQRENDSTGNQSARPEPAVTIQRPKLCQRKDLCTTNTRPARTGRKSASAPMTSGTCSPPTLIAPREAAGGNRKSAIARTSSSRRPAIRHRSSTHSTFKPMPTLSPTTRSRMVSSSFPIRQAESLARHSHGALWPAVVVVGFVFAMMASRPYYSGSAHPSWQPAPALSNAG